MSHAVSSEPVGAQGRHTADHDAGDNEHDAARAPAEDEEGEAAGLWLTLPLPCWSTSGREC